jgi:hypothetical protein
MSKETKMLTRIADQKRQLWRRWFELSDRNPSKPLIPKGKF